MIFLPIHTRWIQSNFERIGEKYCWRTVLSAPQSVYDSTFSKFNVFRHLAFKYLICGMKESLRSKRILRNLKSSTTGKRDPYKYSSGSLCTFRN